MEKRMFVRARLRCKIVIYAPHEHSIITETENIGAGGLRVVIDEKLEVASICSLEFFLNETAITCRGKVVWAIEEPVNPAGKNTLFDIGFEFCDIGPEEKAVVGAFVKAIVSEEK